MLANAQVLAITKAAELLGEPIDHFSVAAVSVAVVVQCGSIPTGVVIEVHMLNGCLACLIGNQHSAGHIFARCYP